MNKTKERKTSGRTHLDLLILKLLSKKDMYGYEIRQTLSSRGFNFDDMSIYPVLYRLENEEAISSDRKLKGRRLRVYYHLETLGVEHLAKQKIDYEKTQQRIRQLLNS